MHLNTCSQWNKQGVLLSGDTEGGVAVTNENETPQLRRCTEVYNQKIDQIATTILQFMF